MQLNIFFMIIYVLLSVTIIVQNSLLVAVLGRELMQVKRLSALDMILISLGISKLCLQCTSMLYNFHFYFHYAYVCLYLGIFWHFFNTAIFWFNGLLAVFYCAKVSSFTHRAFLWLKWRISRLVPWLLMASLLISCVVSIFTTIKKLFWFHFNVNSFTSNTTMLQRLSEKQKYVDSFHYIVTLAVPFLLYLAPTIMLIASLWRHMEQIQLYSTGHCNTSMKVHSTALKSLAIFLIFFTSYFLAVFISIIGFLFEKNSWFWVWEAVIYTVSCIHSTLLMLSSPTLRKWLEKKCLGQP
ncbi:taste receptor type 2 member 16-like [Rhynchocyon petersi]